MAETTPGKLTLRLHSNNPETENHSNNPWETSTIVNRLKKRIEKGKPLRIAFFDIDSTLGGNPQIALKVRKRLNKLGYAIVFVSSRTEEMMVSENQYRRSLRYGFNRPEPKLKIGPDGYLQTTFANEIPDLEGLYNPDVIAGTTGTGIIIRQNKGGYAPDTAFTETLRQDSKTWRRETMKVVNAIDPSEAHFRLLPIDRTGSFERSEAAIFPPNFRIHLEIQTGEGSIEKTKQTGLMHRQEILKRIHELRRNPNTPNEIKRQFTNIRITDDSDPEIGKFAMYITPNRGWKAHAAEYVISELQKTLGESVKREDFHTLFAGDSFPDVGMGLWAGLGTDATFLLVGESRLTDAFSGLPVSFGDTKFLSIRRRMTQTGPGEYMFKTPLVRERRIIIGDIAFPNTAGPESILAYLNSAENSH